MLVIFQILEILNFIIEFEIRLIICHLQSIVELYVEPVFLTNIIYINPNKKKFYFYKKLS